MQALSQLSYSPEPEIVGHCNADALVVPSSRDTQMDIRLRGNLRG
jgi:hypothetical protein